MKSEDNVAISSRGADMVFGLLLQKQKKTKQTLTTCERRFLS